MGLQDRISKQQVVTVAESAAQAVIELRGTLQSIALAVKETDAAIARIERGQVNDRKELDSLRGMIEGLRTDLKVVVGYVTRFRKATTWDRIVWTFTGRWPIEHPVGGLSDGASPYA